MSKLSEKNFSKVLASCGMQVCPHPGCWENSRKSSRCVNAYGQWKSTTGIRMEQDIIQPLCESMIDGIPYITIINLLDEYGYFADKQKQHCIPNILNPKKEFSCYKDVKNISERETRVFTKLKLQDFSQELANGITPAPANTPLQSFHGFDDTVLPEAIKNIYGVSKEISYKLQNSRCHKINMMLQYKAKPGKVVVWHGDKLSRFKQIKRECNNVSQVVLPIDAIPLHTNASSWQAVRCSKKSFKHVHGNLDVMKGAKSGEGKQHHDCESQGVTLNTSPYGISHLRHVPIDVLLRVVSIALHNGAVTRKQANLLLHQVTGRKHILPPLQENPHQLRVSIDYNSVVLKPKTFEISNFDGFKRKSLHETKGHSTDYMIDRQYAVTSKSHVPPKNRSFSVDPMLKSQNVPTSNDAVAVLPELEIMSSLKPYLKPRHEVPLRRLRVHPSNISVATLEADMNYSTPTRPFHYLRHAQDLSLGPMPTPPPSPSAERDSECDATFGFSNVLAHASNAPSLSLSNQESSITSELFQRYNKPGLYSGTVASPPLSVSETRLSPIKINQHKTTQEEDTKKYSTKSLQYTTSREATTLAEIQDGNFSKSDDAESPAPPPPSPEIHVASIYSTFQNDMVQLTPVSNQHHNTNIEIEN